MAQRGDLCIGVGFDFHGDRVDPVGWSLAGDGPLVEGGLNDSLSGGQFGCGEETGAPLSHRQQQFAVDGGVEVESEETGTALEEKLIDRDVVHNRFSGLGHRPVKRDDGIEQAIDGQPFGERIDPEISRKKQIGLPRLDGDAGGDSPAIKIPGLGMDIVLGDNTAVRHGTGLAGNGDDAVDQHQRFIGKTNARGVGIGKGEISPKHFGNGADGVFEAEIAVEGDVAKRVSD